MDTGSMLAELNERFGMPPTVNIVAGNGGLAEVVVSKHRAGGEMYRHGGHVTSWIPDHSNEVLYCSPHSLWQDGRAIRGGVPICFPWFGNKADDPAAPAHGFVRTNAWKLMSTAVSPSLGTSVAMMTESDETTRKWWPHDCHLLMVAIFGNQLTLKLTVTNTGTTPFTFEEALHAYFRVGDAESAILQGLDGTDYIDKTDHGTRKTHHGDLTFSAETDRVFLDTQHVIEVQDPVMGRRIILQKQNSLTTVVWNPWAEKSRSMSDLGDEEWRNFVCVEASNVGQYAVHLAPGQGHVMQVDVHVASL